MRTFVCFLTFFCHFLFGAPQMYTVKDYSRLYSMQGFDQKLLQMHFTLYAGYVKNTNLLLEKLQSMNESGAYEYGALKRRFGWEYDGMRLHELYFENLGGNGKLDSDSKIQSLLVQQFGSFENWKKDFIATGLIRGIGWTILYMDPVQKRLVNTWINEHDVGHLAGGVPLLVMDVFEHAYMPQFGLDRNKYIETFFFNLDWKEVERRLPSH